MLSSVSALPASGFGASLGFRLLAHPAAFIFE